MVPPDPPLSNPSRVVKSSPLRVSRPPWHSTQFFSRIAAADFWRDWTSASRVGSSAERGVSGLKHRDAVAQKINAQTAGTLRCRRDLLYHIVVNRKAIHRPSLISPSYPVQYAN